MTDQVASSDNQSGFEAYMAQMRDHQRRIANARPANKEALFTALAAAGIATVRVTFDGCGDSGQIESLTAHAGDVAKALPEVTVQFVVLQQGGDDIDCRSITLAEAIEHLVYDVLEEKHPGWENDDGAFGEFTFDVASRSITLDYNERHMETDYHQHEL